MGRGCCGHHSHPAEDAPVAVARRPPRPPPSTTASTSLTPEPTSAVSEPSPSSSPSVSTSTSTSSGPDIDLDTSVTSSSSLISSSDAPSSGSSGLHATRAEQRLTGTAAASWHRGGPETLESPAAIAARLAPESPDGGAASSSTSIVESEVRASEPSLTSSGPADVADLLPEADQPGRTTTAAFADVEGIRHAPRAE